MTGLLKKGEIYTTKLNNPGFEKLFRDYFKPLTAFSKKIVGDLDDAKEIVHEVFINLWNKKETIDLEKSVKSYLYTSVYNRSLNYIRDKRRIEKENLTEINANVNSAWNFEDQMDSIQLEEKIINCLESLPEKCREVFTLSRFDGLKYQEIAEKLNISVKTVETQISKALHVFRIELKEYLTILLLIGIFQN